MTAFELPPPQNWQDFEKLCRDLWQRIWGDPGAQLYGRSGQEQFGVDVFGRPGQVVEWAGVQCKLKSRGGALTRSAIEKEVAKAERFNPRLSRLVIATTAPRDAGVQEAAREITAAQLEKGSFAVEVAAWDDVCGELDLQARPLNPQILVTRRRLGTSLSSSDSSTGC